MPQNEESSLLDQHEAGHYVGPHGYTYHPHLEWVAPLFVERSRGFWWYFFVVFGFSALAFWFVYQQEFISAAVIGLLETLVLLYAVEDGRDVIVRVDDMGVTVANNFYGFDVISSFWFIVVEDEIVMQFSLERQPGRVVSAVLNGMDLELLRALMSVHIVEDESKEESLIDRVGKSLKV